MERRRSEWLPQYGPLVVLTQWTLGRYGWGRWHLCPANVERVIDGGELDVAFCGARPRRGAVVREASSVNGPVPLERLCQRCFRPWSDERSPPAVDVPRVRRQAGI